MEILYILIPISVVIVTLAIVMFGWAVKNGQYDDLDGPAHSILFDDDEELIPDDIKSHQNDHKSDKPPH